MWSALENVPHALERNVYSGFICSALVLYIVVCRQKLNSTGLLCHLGPLLPYLLSVE